MGHNINYNGQTGKHSFFSVKEKAWHGLGQIVQDFPTSAEAMVFAGLNYTVEKRPLFSLNGENLATFNSSIEGENTDGIVPDIHVPDFFATVRTDTQEVLGVVGKDYSVVQNLDAFSFFDSIVGGGEGIMYETAGALGKGERVFITAKLPSYIKVGRDDLIEQYIYLTTSHDGGGSITAAFTPIRICCNNTLNAAMKSMNNVVRIRHSSGAGDRLKIAHRLMGLSNNLGAEMEAVFNSWAKVRISDVQLKKLIQLAMAPNKEVIGKVEKGEWEEASSVYKNITEEVYTYSMANETQQTETTKGTLFGAYNSVTGYFQNVRRFKDAEAKFTSISEGTAKQRGQVAFDLCSMFAKNGNIGFN